MKLENGKLYSEGKLFEVMPVILTAAGEPFMLPPTVYKVPNWLVGFEIDHPIGKPITFGPQSRLWIPGTNTSQNVAVEYWTRLLEDSDMGVVSATVTEGAVTAMVQAFWKGNLK
jgi:hypothetical protein